jgi:hypothetical protein
MPTILGQIVFALELRNGGRIRGVAISANFSEQTTRGETISRCRLSKRLPGKRSGVFHFSSQHTPDLLKGRALVRFA